MYGVDYLTNRPGTIYGPGQDCSPESGWLSWFVRASREKLPITIYGDGKQSRDVLWVEDYVDLLVDQINNWKKYHMRTYEVGGGEENEVTLLQVLKFLKYKNYAFAPERLGDMKRFVSDNNFVSSVNGWKPAMGWKEGVKKL